MLNLPEITIGNAHERPEGMDLGMLVMAGLNRGWVLDEVRVIVEQHDPGRMVIPPVADYETPAVSKQVLRIGLSYVDYVNRSVWSKNP